MLRGSISKRSIFLRRYPSTSLTCSYPSCLRTCSFSEQHQFLNSLTFFCSVFLLRDLLHSCPATPPACFAFFSSWGVLEPHPCFSAFPLHQLPHPFSNLLGTLGDLDSSVGICSLHRVFGSSSTIIAYRVHALLLFDWVIWFDLIWFIYLFIYLFILVWIAHPTISWDTHAGYTLYSAIYMCTATISLTPVRISSSRLWWHANCTIQMLQTVIEIVCDDERLQPSWWILILLRELQFEGVLTITDHKLHTCLKRGERCSCQVPEGPPRLYRTCEELGE